jgi:hypothetical protein
VGARAALETVQRRVLTEFPKNNKDETVDWVGAWDAVFSSPAYQVLKQCVDKHKQGDKCMQKRSYGALFMKIHRMLSNAVHGRDTVVVTLRVGALNSKEVRVLACLLHCFQ